MGKLLRALAVALILLLLTTSIALAIANPTSGPTIEGVDMYRHCLEIDDMLVVVQYYLNYTTNPDETINQAYFGRLMEGVVEHANVAPYSYYGKGYDHGVFSMYLSASEAPSWNGTYTIRFEGNPTLSWEGAIPNTIATTINKHATTTQQATEVLLGSNILSIATQLSDYWTVSLITETAAGSKLSSYGEQYFVTSIPNLRTLLPNIFAGDIEAPIYEEKTYVQSGRDTLLNRWSGTDVETHLNNLAVWTTIPITVVKGILWLVPSMLVVYFISLRIKDTRPALFLALLMMPLGNLLGMLSLTFTIIFAVICVLALGYAFFYQRA